MQPRWYQSESVDSIFSFFASNGGVDESGQPVKANPLICLPTGTGKSLVIALFAHRALGMYPTTRLMMLTHVKELIGQNASKLREIWPQAPLGVYSAGLGKRDLMNAITYGGIKSVLIALRKNPRAFGVIDILLVDEAHLIPGSGDSAEYLEAIRILRGLNPWLKVVGLTATPYRPGLGCMTNGEIFSHICYNLCTPEGFQRLLDEGYICPLVVPSRDAGNLEALVQIDISNVGMSNGEFNQKQLEEAASKITYKAIEQTVNFGLMQDRKAWLLFASGVKHTEECAELLNCAFGVPASFVHSKRTKKQNDDALEAYRYGEVRAMVNAGKLTTGYDHPPTDLLGVLRASGVTGLWVQILGRGTRPYDPAFVRASDPRLAEAFPVAKKDTLVLDFGGNTVRLGPINDPIVPKRKGLSGNPGDSPVKTCNVCGVFNHTTAKLCVACGSEFPKSEVPITKQASTAEVMVSTVAQIEEFNVQSCILTRHVSRASGRVMIKVAYLCGLRTFYEHISFETAGFFGKKSRDWFRQRYGEPWDNMTNDQVLKMANQMRHPVKISVHINKPNPEIVSYVF